MDLLVAPEPSCLNVHPSVRYHVRMPYTVCVHRPGHPPKEARVVALEAIVQRAYDIEDHAHQHATSTATLTDVQPKDRADLSVTRTSR